MRTVPCVSKHVPNEFRLIETYRKTKNDCSKNRRFHVCIHIFLGQSVVFFRQNDGQF